SALSLPYMPVLPFSFSPHPPPPRPSRFPYTTLFRSPTVGPTVGGYITDLMSWHWLFFINIVPGVIITVGVLALVDFDQPNFALRSEEHTSELQSRFDLVCRLLLEKKNKHMN